MDFHMYAFSENMYAFFDIVYRFLIMYMCVYITLNVKHVPCVKMYNEHNITLHHVCTCVLTDSLKMCT